MLKLTLQYFTLLLFFVLSIDHACGQGNQRFSGMGGNGPDQEGDEGAMAPKVTITPDVRVWHRIDDFTFSDTVAVDTLSSGYQVFNPIFQRSIGNVHTGNLGSAYQSMVYEDIERQYGYLFFNSHLAYMPTPQKLYFYNTKTPYVNLGYHFGGPRRTSEEGVTALFTQNVNRKLNVGAQYQLNSSIGQYQSQKAENQNFRFFTSYNGDRYHLHAAFLYTKIKNYENGGLNRSQVDFDFTKLEPDEVAVHFGTAQNHFTDHRIFIDQSLQIGNIKVKGKDSIPDEMPIGTIYHSLELEQGKKHYFIDDLPNYYQSGTTQPFYPNIYSDTLNTSDSLRVQTMRNTFQIKFNEEANALLKFGLRAFIQNDISSYRFPKQPTQWDKEDGKYYPRYLNTDTTLVTTAIGGQVFKNLGKNFWWKAGAKLYFQGYRAGDSELTGKINSSFKVFNDTAGVFAAGGILLTAPELFENQYFSNHVKWNNDFRKRKTVYVNGGMRIPTRDLELSAGIRLLNDHIYWQFDGTPDQSSDVVQVYNVRLKKTFHLGNVHSLNDAVLQQSSNQDVIPLPLITLYNSTYYQNVLFQVLHFQIGVDIRYNSAYYAPAYMPATGLFVNQSLEKIGDYPWVDAFLNVQLKRARIYVKFDHVNQGYPKVPYYTAYNYPGNPRSLKFGVSWNFYD